MDTATPLPPGLRRVAIDPLSRVEGHGKVTLLIDDAGQVVQARLHIVEFRGFERFIVGRPWWEVPVMVQRLCGICPVSHHLAASKALEVALGLAAVVPPAAQALRRLMHHGQILQSHALHFFHLSSPELLLGTATEPARRSIAEVARRHPDIARQGVLLRRFGQEVIRVTAGKRVHGTGSIPGGMNRRPTADEIATLRAGLPEVVGWCEAAVDLVLALRAQDPAGFDGFAAMRSSWLGLVAADGTLDLYDGRLRWRGADGAPLGPDLPDQDYASRIEEATEPWTYLKFPYLRAQGRRDGWYRVGPLARLQVADRLSTPRAEARRRAFVAGGPVHGSLAYHVARMIEMLHAAEVIGELLEHPALPQGQLAAAPPGPAAAGSRREGVGVIEAPRGTLIHHYRLGDDDLVADCNLIVSTTHNNEAMNEAVRRVAQDELSGHEITEPLLARIETAVRAYDPCLSCATHALGRMPLELALQAADGRLLDRVVRDGDGRVQRLPA